MKSSSAELGAFNKSSLVSLKAELERKKQEIKKLQTGAGTTEGVANCAKYREKPIRKLHINERANQGVAGRLEKDSSEESKEEEGEELKQSQNALAAKAKIYEDLMRGKKVLETSNQVLVNFDEKRKEKEKERVTEDSWDEDSDDEWTEFTDALGRTRKCLKTDLKHYQNQNKLLEHIKRDTESIPSKVAPDRKGNDESQLVPPGFSAELLSFDMKRELMRKQWEEQEQKLEGKASVHYQDILFGEARQHGVGYFRFSSDERTRAEEIEKLNAERAQTKLERARAKEMRRLRKRQFKTRLLMTENRKRESQGLPPLPLDVDNISSSEDEDEKAEEEARKQTALNDLIARKVEEIRKANKTREWDAGKDGQMSQEEWVERQRAERKQEFAPPTNQDEEGGDNRGGHKWQGSDERQNQKGVGKSGKISGDGEKEGSSIHGFSTYDSREKNPASLKDNGGESSSLSDEQLLKQLETEEAYSANSIFCFKRKWADRNKEVFRRYQKPKADRKETSVETTYTRSVENSHTRVQIPLVDSRFIENSSVKKAESRSSFGDSSDKDKPGSDKQEMEVDVTGNHASFGAVKRFKSEVPHKQTNSSLIEPIQPVPDFKADEESQDDDLMGPPMPNEFIVNRKIEAESSKETRHLVQKENGDGDLIGPPIPKQLLVEQTEKSEVIINDQGRNEDDDLIGPPIPTQLLPEQMPKNPIKPLSTSQLAAESKADSKSTQLIPTQITKYSKSSLIPSTLIPRQIAKAPLIPTSLRPRQITSHYNAFLKTGKLSNTNKESVIETSKNNSAMLQEVKATSEEENSKAIDDTEDQSGFLEKKGVQPNKDTEKQDKQPEEQITGLETDENTSYLSGKSTASNVQTSESKIAPIASSETDPLANTTFDFLSAKSKSDSLKRKLDRPNVQFDENGRLVNKSNQADRFRSFLRGAEADTSRAEDSRSSAKRAEIAPPSSMEYFTSASSSRGKKRGGGPGAGRGMMESLKVGMKKVEEKKKMRGEKKEKGLLDIM